MNNSEGRVRNSFVEVILNRKLFIIVFVVICVLSTAIYSLLIDKLYEATAVILLSPPPFRNLETETGIGFADLAPKSLSVKTYKELLMNDSILYELREKLKIKNKRGKPILLDKLREMISIKIDIIQETPSGINYSPAMSLEARSNSPEKAVELANVWAEIAVEKAKDISEKSKEGSISFLLKEYKRVKEQLAEDEDILQKSQDKYDKELEKLQRESQTKLRELKDKYDNEISKLMKDTESLYKVYDVETFNKKKEIEDKYDEMITNLTVSLKVDLKKRELETLKLKIGLYQERLLDIQNEQNTLSGKYSELQKEIEKHPQLIVLSKAITDDALWNKISRQNPESIPDEIKKLKLRDEELNPVYITIMTDLATTRVSLNTAKAEEKSVTDLLKLKINQRDKLNMEILEGENKIDKLVREKETEIDKFARERDAGSKEIIEAQDTKAHILEREKVTEFAILTKERTMLEDIKNREKDVICNRLSREVENLQEKNKTLASNYLNAQITEEDKTPDIRKISDAVVPDQRIYPKRTKMVIVAFLVSLIFGILYVNLAQYLKENFYKES